MEAQIPFTLVGVLVTLRAGAGNTRLYLRQLVWSNTEVAEGYLLCIAILEVLIIGI